MATLADLQALMAKSEAKWQRKRALNYGRAKHVLRETDAGLDALQAAAGYLTVRDSVNQRWMREQ